MTLKTKQDKTMEQYRKTLLVNPGEIKTNSLINWNVDDSYLNYTVMNAQEIYLEGITGTALYRRLQELVYNQATSSKGDKINDAEMTEYKDLLEGYVKPYLISRVMVDILYAVTYKVRNTGVTRTSDTNIEPVSMDDVKQLERQYMTYCDQWSAKLSKYLEDNKGSFDELSSDSPGYFEDATLDKSYGNTGLWLGPRGNKKRC